MYLRRKPKWSMTRKRYRVNKFTVALLLILIAAMTYVNRVIVPTIPPPFVPTPTATRSPESFIVDAETAFNEGKLSKSVELYQQAIRANPQNDAVYAAMGRVQIFAALYDDALESADKAILLNPNNPRAHAIRAWAMDFKGDLLAAEAAIKRALELDANSGFIHAIYAEILVDSALSGTGPLENLTVKAAETSRLALSLEPNAIETHRARGYVLEATANYPEAIAEYQAAIAINPNIADLHIALGRNYHFTQVYDLAVDEFNRANTLNPSDPTPDRLISRTYATIGEFAKAAQYAESAVKDAPADPSLHGNYGVMLYYTANWQESAAQLGLAINGGRTEGGDTIEAISFSTNSRVVEYYFTYALALARVNRCGEAIPIANTILGRVSDELSISNAQKALAICEANLAATPTPTPKIATTETPTATATATP
ncbi:MAG: tetratricopeptide repeat protein [Chloroflexi bacterium]|nr:tetratricopeptide repeat protein [Chloroflexota bacterium]